MNMLKILVTKVTEILIQLGAPKDIQAVIKLSIQARYGDYQCNSIMSVAKEMGVNPRSLAHQVVENLELDSMLEKIEVAGPGFINFYFSRPFIENRLMEMYDENRLDISLNTKPLNIVVDYSAPNVAKEMHVGHIRSTIIGDSVSRVLDFLGHKVIRQNHIGDWGTQFGMLIAYLEELEKCEQQESLFFELSDLERFYKKSKIRFDNDIDFAKKARKYVVELQAGDEYCKSLWQKLVEVTLSHNQEVYERLNVSLTNEHVKGESSYNDSLSIIIDELKNKNLIQENQGAKVVVLEQFRNKSGNSMGVIVQKSDGGFLYTTTDLAAIRYRVHTLNANRILYFVDSRQSQHFQQVLLIARKAGFAHENTLLEHAAIGMMLGEDGKPFKTRSGTTVKLVDLINEAEARVAALLASRNTDLNEEQKVDAIKIIATASIKYADLSKNRTSDYMFSWDKMLAFEGNTALYILYAYTRIQSIFRKGNKKIDQLLDSIFIRHSYERDLAFHLMRIHEVLDQVADEGMPHYLCNYIYELASLFMKFYEHCPIYKKETAPEIMYSRLKLCAITAKNIRLGFDLLGIKTLNVM